MGMTDDPSFAGPSQARWNSGLTPRVHPGVAIFAAGPATVPRRMIGQPWPQSSPSSAPAMTVGRPPFRTKSCSGLGVNETAPGTSCSNFWDGLLFYRERLAVETDVQNDAIPFVPDFVPARLRHASPCCGSNVGNAASANCTKLAVQVSPRRELWGHQRLAGGKFRPSSAVWRRKSCGGIGTPCLRSTPKYLRSWCPLCRERNQFHLHRAGLRGGATSNLNSTSSGLTPRLRCTVSDVGSGVKEPGVRWEKSPPTVLNQKTGLALDGRASSLSAFLFRENAGCLTGPKTYALWQSKFD